MASLSGRPNGPALGTPTGLVDKAMGLAEAIERCSGQLGGAVTVDPLGLMAERASLGDLTRNGSSSCGAGTRLLPAADNWVGLTLSRADDWDLVAALLEVDAPVPDGDWDAVRKAVATRTSGLLRDRATLVGLPLAVLGERATVPASNQGADGLLAVDGITTERIRARSADGVGTLGQLVVADLSSLWAGPTVGRLLALAGASVVKVESITRPDGARSGEPRFFDRLNQDKASVALDFATPTGRSRLHQIVSRSDVVITSCRSRALEALGLDPRHIIGTGRPRAWVAISGYGSATGDSNRVAFGDDAAVAGGLVLWDGGSPCFCGDAVADPLTGLGATATLLEVLGRGGGWLIEASMADIAAGARGPVGEPHPLRARRAPSIGPPVRGRRPTEARAGVLGEQTDLVLSALGIR